MHLLIIPLFSRADEFELNVNLKEDRPMLNPEKFSLGTLVPAWQVLDLCRYSALHCLHISRYLFFFYQFRTLL